MKNSRVALRYAKSLISLAEERQILEQVKEDMLTIKLVCEENHDFTNMLKSPIVKSDAKSAVVNNIFATKVCELSLAFINIVTDKKREAILGAIAENFIILYNESKNIVTASISTASAMSDDIRNQVLSQLQSVIGNAEVQIEERVDESLIGGFVLRVGDREFNASVANKLQKLKREFVSTRT
jgi:F-type H+-transporting ATPase subunit delta